jgi:hypothetical protein
MSYPFVVQRTSWLLRLEIRRAMTAEVIVRAPSRAFEQGLRSLDRSPVCAGPVIGDPRHDGE